MKRGTGPMTAREPRCCLDCGVPLADQTWWYIRNSGLAHGPLCEKCLECREQRRRDVDSARYQFRTSALAIATERVDLLCRKQNDYGPHNIASMGYAGLLVRMNDKMERLKHLMLSGKEPDNEAVDDTLDDIGNYALIWQMGKRGEWPVPFEPIVLRRMEP